MIRFFFILALVIGCRLLVIGQNVIIKGKVDSSYFSDADKIYAYTYEDYISYKDKELLKSKFDEKGNFNLSFSVSATTYIFLIADNAKAEMVVEPNKMYEINFLPCPS